MIDAILKMEEKSSLCIMPSQEGRCGICGFSSFEYKNGFIESDCGIRGYRCTSCNAIKPEGWRDLEATQGETITTCSQKTCSIGFLYDYQGNYVPVWELSSMSPDDTLDNRR